MPEGPSLLIAKEQMFPFTGKKIVSVSGNSKIGIERLEGERLKKVRSWGKHLLFEFRSFSVRVHFLMFGTYRVNEKKESPPRLHMQFRNGEINLYACSVKFIAEPLDEVYDWTSDVLSDQWNARAARKKLKAMPHLIVADALLDQNIFSGVGNIIKNEVLYRIRVHPASHVGALPPRKLTQLINEARNYSFDFLEWKKAFVLKKNWLAHTKKTCIRDGSKITKEYIGTTNRRTFFCAQCQVKYK